MNPLWKWKTPAWGTKPGLLKIVLADSHQIAQTTPNRKPKSSRGPTKTATLRPSGTLSAVNKRVLYVLPTGGGKTVIFGYVAAETARRGKRILIPVHRQELLDQTIAALKREGVTCGSSPPATRRMTTRPCRSPA